MSPNEAAFWLDELRKALPDLRYPANPHLCGEYAAECQSRTMEALDYAITALNGRPLPQNESDLESS